MGEQAPYEGLLDERGMAEGYGVRDVQMGKPHRSSAFFAV